MKRILAGFFVLFFVFNNIVYAEEIEEPSDLYAQSAVLMDAESGRILFEKNGQEVMAMASTTKIMTCILALESGNLTDVVTTSGNAAIQPKVHLGMQEGEQFYLKDLLYSLMLESHNDSAVAIAEHVGGSVEKFAQQMNQKALEIGCNNTHFVTPNGLDEEDDKGMHATTATELARIMSYCILKSPKREQFLEITGTPSYVFHNVEGNRTFQCNNKNSFLQMMDGAISGKTGFTGKAGYCYVGAVERDGRTFVVALLACGWPNNKDYKWKDTKKLMEYAVANYTYRNIYETPEFSDIEVKGGVPQTEQFSDAAYAKLDIAYDDKAEFDFLLRADENVEIRYELPKKLEAPVKSGETVGHVIYSLEGEVLKECNIIVIEYVPKKDVAWYMKKIAKSYFCMGGI